MSNINNEILNLSPIELLETLSNMYYIELPQALITIQDMEDASTLLLKLSGDYQYLVTLSSYAKLATREAKRNSSKEAYEDMIDKKEMIQNFVEIVKQNYKALSRAITVHMENNEELKMVGG